MNKKLLELPSGELLQKFGMGNHKPGSGSAAAFQGLLSAQLVRTVISLTNEEKRRNRYAASLPELLRMNVAIETRICPSLEKLCEEDSVQFDKYICILRERDAEINPERHLELDRMGLKELIPATDIPFKIAVLCKELCEFAIYVFDHGFKAARGDAAVALNGAIASVAGCLSIINLNLSKFGCNDWTLRVRLNAEQLRDDLENLSVSATTRITEFDKSCRSRSFAKSKADINNSPWEDLRLSEPKIEEIARQIQNVLWGYKDFIWKDEIESLLDVLKPEVAIEDILGYKFQYANLGQHDIDGNAVDIAGLIDKDQKEVFISKGFPQEVQNFTAAHELGHALLHKGMVQHRDRPLDGSFYTRDLKENQADKFAAHFLMPGKLVTSVFKELFITEKFILNQDTAFQLGERSVANFRAKYKNLRGLSRFLASTDNYRGRPFNSISKTFNVSVGAMAIRLEELGLVEFDNLLDP